jgi:endonuclease/exonuclease/phosphatase family metal-dependent hydrolase
VSVRVATFNVHHGAPRRGGVDLDSTIEACRSLDADVLALQELDAAGSRSGGVDQPRTLADVLGMHLVFAPTVEFRDGGRYGHALLSRHPLRDVDVLVLEMVVGREPRVAILAVTSAAGRDVSIASIHLDNGQRGERRPPLAIRQLTETVAALQTRPRPRLLLGDMNLEDGQISTTLAAGGLVPVRSTPTLPSDRPGSTPDHVAVDGLTVEAVWVPSTTVSDHRPVVVELS